MNKNDVTSLAARIAKKLEAEVFATQDALDKYLKEHPDADRSLHRVKKERMFEDIFSPSHMSQHPSGFSRRITVSSELVKIAKELVSFSADVRNLSKDEVDQISREWKERAGKYRSGNFRSGQKVTWDGDKWYVYDFRAHSGAPEKFLLTLVSSNLRQMADNVSVSEVSA